MSIKVCALCGREFDSHGTKAKYCKLPFKKICIACGEEFNAICWPKANDVCDKPECKRKAGCAGFKTKSTFRKCQVCGNDFIATNANQTCCGRSITKLCIVCGKEFEAKCTVQESLHHTTCSIECKNQYARSRVEAHYLNTTRICKWCGKEFHPRINSQILCEDTHYETCIICGEKFELPKKFDLNDHKMTCSNECTSLYKFRNGNPFQLEDCRKKANNTMLEKYGKNYRSIIASKSWATFEARTGYSYPSHSPEVRSKAAKSAKVSKLELRIASMLYEYGIEFIHHYMLTDKIRNLAHEYDFYIPKYRILLDADGLYFHSYTSDPDGRQVSDNLDDVRLALVPSDHIFHIIIEQNEDKGMKELVEIIKSIDSGAFDYDSKLFDWCRSIEFPYPFYDDKRLNRDYKSLCDYTRLDKYTPHCRLGESIIRNYHHSIYHAHCGNSLSPYDGWYNDDVLKKTILNRLIYINNVDPSKILRGLYISKLAPRVSIFNPVLAKYLITKYLPEYTTIFDPFSGYSGRLLGACSLGKRYIGQDLNDNAVDEANQIISFLNLDATVSQKDTLESSGEYDCLLTCPPYSTKEIYANETVFKSCDDWIDECLNRFNCNKYIFVVGSTKKYKDFIVETLGTASHLTKITEYVICLTKQPSIHIA